MNASTPHPFTRREMVVLGADGERLGRFIGMIGDEIEIVAPVVAALSDRFRLPADWVASMDRDALRLSVTRDAVRAHRARDPALHPPRRAAR